MTITNKEHKVIAHVLKFIDTHYSKTQASVKKNIKILKAVRVLRDKLDFEFGNYSDKKSPYFGWNTERGLSDFLLNDMEFIVEESDKLAEPVRTRIKSPIIIPKKYFKQK